MKQKPILFGFMLNTTRRAKMKLRGRIDFETYWGRMGFDPEKIKKILKRRSRYDFVK